MSSFPHFSSPKVINNKLPTQIFPRFDQIIMQDPSTYSSQINPQFPEHQHLNCPRCDSNNTKFCYYNNYNLSQPRHFCKNCKRYWTKGGILRNIPVGGGSRKITKRSSNPKKSPAPPPSPVTSTSPSSSTAQSQPKSSGGQFGNFIDVESLESGGFTENPNSDESSRAETSPTEIRTNSNDSVTCSGVQNGDGLGYGWPGLSIFMPGSDFQ